MNNQFSGPSKFWTKFDEWKAGKTITPMSCVKACGQDTKAKYRDKDGCVYQMKYIDHDNGDLQRLWETPYQSFEKSLISNGVKGGNKYHVTCTQNGKQWIW